MKTGCGTRGIAKIPIKHPREGVAIFIRIWGNKPLDEINNEDFEKINKECTIERAYSASFDNQVVNALNLFFQNPQQRNLNLQLIYRL